jgi:hypothetical protein
MGCTLTDGMKAMKGLSQCTAGSHIIRDIAASEEYCSSFSNGNPRESLGRQDHPQELPCEILKLKMREGRN